MAMTEREEGSTSIDIDSEVPKSSITNGSAARKFVSPDNSANENDTLSQVKDNSEHVSEQMSSLKSVAVSLQDVIDSSRQSLDTVREAIDGVVPESNIDAREKLPYVDQNEYEDSMIFTAARKDDTLIPYNSVTPSLDSVSVSIDKNISSIDCFLTTLKFHINSDDANRKKIKAFRIFRSTSINPKFKRGTPVLSAHGVERLQTRRLQFRSKNQDYMSQIETRLRESGVYSSISVLNSFDPTTNLRISTEDGQNKTHDTNSFKTNLVGTSTSAGKSFLSDSVESTLDMSVADDLNSVKNLRSRIPSSNVVEQKVTVGPSKTTKGATATISIDESNSAEFREIAVLSLDKLRSREIGGVTEYTYIDNSVSYGRGYRYYIVTVDKNMIDSVRSKYVDVVIEGVRVPPSPKRVYGKIVDRSISLAISVDDQLIEKFEIYKRDLGAMTVKKGSVDTRQVSDARGFNVAIGSSRMSENMYIRVGESLNGYGDSGSTFYDKAIVPGKKYAYRVYSVDVFGNKSERPSEIEIFVPDPGGRTNDLTKPSLTTEVDPTTNKMKLSFSCDDQRVRILKLSRRDLTINQKTFTTPSQVNIIKLGNGNSAGSKQFEDIISHSENQWSGIFENVPGKDITFIDKTVSLDHMYQYKISGIDRFGNSTVDVLSSTVLVTRRPIIGKPINVNTTVVQGPNFAVGGVQISWQDSNVNVTARDMLGNRTSYDDSSVRVLFQVERKKVGEDRWQIFPLTEQLVLFDASTQAGQSSGIRPSLVEANQTYMYRVKALQTGSYVSDYSQIAQVFASLPIKQPENFRVRFSDASVNPFYVVLNWDTPNGSAVIDRWEIQRASLNNFAAARINPKNPVDFGKLSFKEFRTIFRESSRFKSHDLDNIDSPMQQVLSSRPTENVFTGQHQFQDQDVTFGNSYFYRIRCVGIDGTASSWSYRGVRLTNSSFEKKFMSPLSDFKKRELVSSNLPLRIADPFEITSYSDTFSLDPDFSRSDRVQTVNVDSQATQQRTVALPTFGNVAVLTTDMMRAKVL